MNEKINDSPIQRHHPIELRYAWEGVKYSLTTQPNFLVHLIAAIVVTIAGFIFKISVTEWLLVVFAIATVVVTELINTALESLVDLVTSEYHPKAKIAKDVAAAAVLIAACGALVVGIIIFLPKVITLLIQ